MKTKILAAAFTALVLSAGAAHAQMPGACPGDDDPVSPKQYVKTKVTFTNATDSRLNIFWIDYEGERVRMGRFVPGQTATVNTFVGHPWAFVTDNGICVDLYIASKTERRHTVRD
jgi:hypothetical protein